MNKKRYSCRFIGFFGPDGTGKTTQARLLREYLKAQGHRTRIAWMRGRHSFAFILAKFLERLGYYRLVKLPSGVVYKVSDPMLIPKLKVIWGFIEFASILPWIIQRVYLPIFFGYTVIAERYVVDTVVYLGYWLGHDFLNGFLAKVLLNLIPRSSLLIHLDAETQTLLERSQNDVVTKDYIVFQRRIYRILAKRLKATTIDTSKSSIEETFQHIIENLV